MSFHFGQFRRDQLAIGSYTTAINFSVQNFQRKTGTTVEKNFIDKMIVPAQSLDNTKSYYFEVSFNKLTTTQNFTLILKKSTDNNIEQTITTFSVPSGSGTQNFEFVVSPTTDFDQIVFYLTRTSTDYQLSNGDGTYGRKPTVSVVVFRYVNNLIDTTIHHTPLIKIGVQGSPGMLMVINGEPIRIGPNRKYEINNGYKIKSFGAIIKNDSSSTDGK